MDILLWKQCKTCEEWKLFSDFKKDKRSREGRRNICKKCSSVWNERNKDKTLEAARRWRSNHLEDVRKSHREWAKEHYDSFKEKKSKWFRDNPEKVKQYNRKKNQAHPELTRERRRNRRAQIKGNGGTITSKEWEQLLEEAHFKCLCCGSDSDLTLDHITPLVLGGRHEKNNAQVLCRSCNSKKRIKIIDYRKR